MGRGSTEGTARQNDDSVAESLEVEVVEAKSSRRSKPAKPSKPEPKHEAKPQAKLQTKHQAKPEAKLQAKPQAKPEAKPEVKPEAKPEAKPSLQDVDKGAFGHVLPEFLDPFAIQHFTCFALQVQQITATAFFQRQDSEDEDDEEVASVRSDEEH
ncbi:Autotransporter outer membrane beta-barrel domain-containing protein [Durusdinium trenchii]|uniref:Autotransporter outer membrane beta-barrel domain-containing protein n=1 Tax=Durusdinium trenchii TaxID=1381693 RepID=A0ABP0HXV0_9DINO